MKVRYLVALVSLVCASASWAREPFIVKDIRVDIKLMAQLIVSQELLSECSTSTTWTSVERARMASSAATTLPRANSVKPNL